MLLMHIITYLPHNQQRNALLNDMIINNQRYSRHVNIYLLKYGVGRLDIKRETVILVIITRETNRLRTSPSRAGSPSLLPLVPFTKIYRNERLF